MAIPRTLQTLEVEKFKESTVDPDKPCVRVCTEGTQSVSGLTIAGRIIFVTLSSIAWVALPVAPLVNRNAISIQNVSGIQMKVNFVSNLGYVGIIIEDGAERFYNITDDIIIFGRATSGSPIIAVEEVS